MIYPQCPNCHATFELDESLLGQRVQCIVCDTHFTIPSRAEDIRGGTGEASVEARAPGRWITCPHCWKRFDQNEIHYISRHIDLLGDPILGEEAQQRFLPTQLSAQGLALDARGLECPEMACPHCHLKIPEAILDQPTSFFSIVGTPASGKSYFLTTMLWQLRKCLPKYFEYNLGDVEASFNSVLNQYETTLFLNTRAQEPVALPKTELQGTGYSNQVLLDGVPVDLPRPFIFSLTPRSTHPQYRTDRQRLERNIVLYDNAGEHFEPGRESASNLATAHLSHSDGLIFLYDPLQDFRLQALCTSNDPQCQMSSANQLALFHEMCARIRKFAGMKASDKYPHPLVLVIAKFDAIQDAFQIQLAPEGYLHYDPDTLAYSLDLDAICSVSFQAREKLLSIAPELVSAAETFSDQVYFVPASAFGQPPVLLQGENDAPAPSNGGRAIPALGIRPCDVHPVWTEVPFLLQMHLLDLLPAAPSDTTNALEITQFKFTEDTFVFTFPGQTTRYELPKSYWGHCLHLPNGKIYRIPSPESAASGDTSAQSSPGFNEAFWKNL